MPTLMHMWLRAYNQIRGCFPSGVQTPHLRVLLAAIAFVLFSPTGESQVSWNAWHPFPYATTGEAYDYTLGPDPVPRYRQTVDSFLVDGADTVWLLRPFPFPCDTCPTDFSPFGTDQTAYFPGHPLFGADRWSRISTDVFEFGGPQDFVWEPRRSPGHIWLFQASSGTQATIDQAFDSLLFGMVLDSVKRVLLSSGDTILCSKAHGILRFPSAFGEGDTTPYRLSGIRQQDLGHPMPTWRELFRMEAGSILAYTTTNASSYTGLQSKSLQVFHVTDVLETADQISVSLEGVVESVVYRDVFPGNTFTYARLKWTLIADSAQFKFMSDTSGPTFERAHGLNLGDPYVSWWNFGWDVPLHPSHLHQWSLRQNETARLEVYKSSLFSPDCADPGMCAYDSINYVGIEEGFVQERQFVVGLGNTLWVDFDGDQTRRRALTGYITPTDTFGALPDTTTWPLGLGTIPTRHQLTAFPNPSTGQVLVSGWNQPATASIFNMTGRVVLKRSFLPGTPIDLSALPNGLYWIELQNKDQRGLAKIALQRP